MDNRSKFLAVQREFSIAQSNYNEELEKLFGLAPLLCRTNKIQIIKAIKDCTGLDLKQSKHIADVLECIGRNCESRESMNANFLAACKDRGLGPNIHIITDLIRKHL